MQVPSSVRLKGITTRKTERNMTQRTPITTSSRIILRVSRRSSIGHAWRSKWAADAPPPLVQRHERCSRSSIKTYPSGHRATWDKLPGSLRLFAPQSMLHTITIVNDQGSSRCGSAAGGGHSISSLYSSVLSWTHFL